MSATGILFHIYLQKECHLCFIPICFRPVSAFFLIHPREKNAHFCFISICFRPVSAFFLYHFRKKSVISALFLSDSVLFRHSFSYIPVYRMLILLSFFQIPPLSGILFLNPPRKECPVHSISPGFLLSQAFFFSNPREKNAPVILFMLLRR